MSTTAVCEIEHGLLYQSTANILVAPPALECEDADAEKCRRFLLANISVANLLLCGKQSTKSGDHTASKLLDEFLFCQCGHAKSTFAGLPWLLFLRRECKRLIHFWPLDGWEVPQGKSAIVEAYPSLPRTSNIGQSPAWQWGILFAMNNKTRILKVERDCDDGLIVTFSDGTRAGYVVEELLLLRPRRERVEEPSKSDRPFTIATKISFSMGGPRSK